VSLCTLELEDVGGDDMVVSKKKKKNKLLNYKAQCANTICF